MDFLVGLLKTLGMFDSVWVNVDQLTKSTHFILVQVTYIAEKVPISIVSNRGTQFTYNCLKAFQKGWGTQSDISIAFHPQTDGRRCCSLIGWFDAFKVLLKISSMKGFIRFGKMGKMSLRYLVRFEVLHRVGDVAYELALLLGLSGVHLIFFVSMLKKYHSDGSYIVRCDSVLLDENLSYEEETIAILDRQVRKLRSKEIASIKVQWKHHPVKEAT
ncbi:uncharacterized protein LOC132607724 [Lycium barbarum]|uniref:uncharacterized protein LOC132607724 n=1 Tax=Lycium barbarum TaxID=112863 RepID=UPI00293F12F4|nr:uncharacterized protein LOC132607724 [Lycium barbarum]